MSKTEMKKIYKKSYNIHKILEVFQNYITNRVTFEKAIDELYEIRRLLDSEK